MQYETTFKLTKEYYLEAYKQRMYSMRKQRLFNYSIGILFMLSGASLAIYSKFNNIDPLVIFLSGIFLLFSSQISKFIWLRRQLQNNSINEEFSILVDENGYKLTGPNSSTEQSWKVIDTIIQTPSGILIRPQKRSMVYISEKLAGKEFIEFVKSQIN